jgi:transcriptional regulator with XRE-family HTH domain
LFITQWDFDMATKKDLSKKLIWLREREGLNQGEFAKKVGLTQAAISQFEDGKRSPSINSLRKICKALGLSLNELTEDPMPTHDNENDAAIEVLVRAVKNSGLSKDAILSLAKFVAASKAMEVPASVTPP